MQVIGYVESATNDTAVVTVRRSSACGGNCKACGGSCETVMHAVKVENTIGAKQGDIVEIIFSEKESLKAGLILYAIPLIAMLISFIASYLMSLGETKALMIAMLSLLVSGVIIYLLDKKNKRGLKLTIKKFEG